MGDRIKVLYHSNYSRLVTGFGKNARNILLALHEDPDIEVFEAANGVKAGTDMMTPWKSYGTIPNQDVWDLIGNDGAKKRAAQYGFYTIDDIVKEVQPDVYLGVEDIWAFTQFENKPWWNNIRKIIWTTLDSLPILDQATYMAERCDRMLVWATFAEEEMRRLGHKNVHTLHGAVDYSNFYPLKIRDDLRSQHNLQDNFIIGFVFKNQLRKSVPNLLAGFKQFKSLRPEAKPKLLLHTDWDEKKAGWDIESYIKELELDPSDILCTYVCHKCNKYFIRPYNGEKKDCSHCGSKESLHTKNGAKGVCEKSLNEIYNIMDVYCHPFTSGGQELPIQEAKAAGRVVLATDYSCGLDAVGFDRGGIALKWAEYREPHTRFIKATTLPESICEELDGVWCMSVKQEESISAMGRKHVEDVYSTKNIVSQLKKHIKEVAYVPALKAESTSDSLTESPPEFDLDGEIEDRILFVMPESAGDVFMSTSLLPSLKKLYPDKDIYFATKKQFFPLVVGNPYVHKVLEFNPKMESVTQMEGRGDHQGYFHVCLLPHIGTQKFFDYQHRGDADKIAFSLYAST